MRPFDPDASSGLRAVLAALRRGSPVVLGVPQDVRHQLLRRYVDVSERNARLSLVAFGLVLFTIAYEAPWWPRLLAFAAMAAIGLGRTVLARRWRAGMDAPGARYDGRHDILVILSMTLWNCAPFALEGHIAAPNLAVAVYASQLSLTVLAVSHVAAQPASLLANVFSMATLVAFYLHQGTYMSTMMAAATVTLTFSLQARLSDNHRTLLKAFAAERENAQLVQELEGFRQTLQTENERLGSSLRDASLAASRDPLTGLFNRRHLLAQAAALGELVSARGTPVVVCMIDIDHFKAINDRHGHAIGDTVLRAVAKRLADRTREGDCLARIGGEEFVAVLRHCDLPRGQRVAQALRQAVADVAIETEAGDLRVTVSIGAAQWAAAQTLADVMDRADQALYRAKRGGRNRVDAAGTDVMTVA